MRAGLDQRDERLASPSRTVTGNIREAGGCPAPAAWGMGETMYDLSQLELLDRDRETVDVLEWLAGRPSPVRSFTRGQGYEPRHRADVASH